MRTHVRDQRRRFLKTALSCGLLELTRPVWAEWVEGQGRRSLPARFLGLLEERESARVIGAEYLRSAPEEVDERVLLDLICSGEDAARLRALSRTELHEFVRLRTRDDFEEDRIVSLQGWMLAVTEARLCALATLA